MKNYIIYISIFLFSIIKSQNNENEIIDSLIYDTHFQKINSNYKSHFFENLSFDQFRKIN